VIEHTQDGRLDMLIERQLRAYMEYNPQQANIIHTTAGGRAYGYQDALVTGTIIYSWCIPTIVEVAGEGWLSRGWIDLDFPRPVYPDDTVTLRIEPCEDPSPEGVHHWNLTVCNAQGITCVTGAFGNGIADWVDTHHQSQLTDPTPPPRPRPPLLLEAAPIGQDLPALLTHTAPSPAVPLPEATPHHGRGPLITGDRTIVNPAFIAGRMSWFGHSTWNYGGPSIHTSTRLQYEATAEAGEPIVVAAHMQDAHEYQGNHYTTLDGTYLTEGGQRIARARHTLIFKVRQPKR